VQLFFLVNIVFFVMNFFIGTPIQQLDRISLRGLTAHTESAEQASAPTTPAKNAAPVYETNITNSADIRLYVWQGAIDAWKDNFLFGTGVETFAFAYYKYRPVGHNLTSEWDYLYNKAHNEYVNYLATTGLVGIGTYAAFILMFCYLMVHGLLRRFIPKFAQAKQTHEPSTAYDASYTIVVIGLFSGWVTILVSNFFGFSVVIINILFFLFPAFALLFGNLLPAYTYRFPKEQGKVSHVTVSQWFSVAVVALFAAYSLFFLLRFWDADKAYALGSNLEHAGELATAYPSLQQAVNLLPSEPVFKDELSYTSAQLAVQLYQQQASASAATAASLATQALSLSDEVLSEHPNNIVFWKTRIRIFYALSQLDQRYLPYAIKAAEKASELAPTDAKIQWNLGVLYGQNGQSDKALATLQKTIALKPDYVDAYYALGLFYHDAGVDATTGKIKDQAMADKGIETMEHILTKMDSNNEQAKKALESWKN
jgi:tetratricopeptide (TPR) repeat protein